MNVLIKLKTFILQYIIIVVGVKKMFRGFIKKKLRLKSSIMTIMTMILIIAFILPQVIAITPTQLNSTTKNINLKPYKSGLLAESIWFIKPVLKKMYIRDKTEVSLNGNRSIIIGPITIQASTELQNELISVRYRFTDMNNNSLGPDVEISWSEEYPNYDYYYAKKHFPFPIQNMLPSKFKIEAFAQFIGIPYASVNITVFKIF